MLKKRIIPCLDVADDKVVKGVQFRDHEVVGDIIELACRYRDEGADELVFYDITASADKRIVGKEWVKRVAAVLDIPFCVAGGIRTVEDAKIVLHEGADKISINSPALERPELINEIAAAVGSQSLVVGIDSRREGENWVVYQYTGNVNKTIKTRRDTISWLQEAEARGAGEIVLNCMDKDGVRQGYDIEQLRAARDVLTIPLIASGGAGAVEHFRDVFNDAHVDGALAASVFHKNILPIPDLKAYLASQDIAVRQ
jgi:cyclase